jgi:tellurite resistance protein TerC
MDHTHIFPFADFWGFYVIFTIGICATLYTSLRAFHAEAKEVTIREASISALSWFGLALIFNVVLYGVTYFHLQSNPSIAEALGTNAADLAKSTALEFLSGYLLEKSLAVDNLFVFIVIFQFFSIPKENQYRVLFYGLFGALVLRAIFIAMGSVVMDISWVVICFGLFLIFQGFSVLRGKEPEIHPEKNRILLFLRRVLPISPKLDGQNFFTRIDGRFAATPLFLALIFVEITDIMFAFDSVPAIFGLTKEPLVVFTSNIFAVIDLRALYFLLLAFVGRFHYLSVGLSFVLIFIGVKMAFLDEVFHYHLPTEISLIVVLSLIVGSMLLSLVRPAIPENEKEGV